MRLNVAMADAEGVNVEQSSKGLIGEELDFEGGEGAMSRPNVGVKVSLVVLHHDVEVLTACLFSRESAQHTHSKLPLKH